MEAPTRNIKPDGVISDSSFLEAHSAAYSNALLVQTHPGFLSLRGKDSLDLLHRISTNSLTDLKIGEIRSTILLTPKGRIIDVITVWNRPNRIVLEITPGREQRVKEWIEQFIIMEEVSIDVVTDELAASILIGPKANSLLEILKTLGYQASSQTEENTAPADSSLGVVTNPLFRTPLLDLICDAPIYERVASELRSGGALQVQAPSTARAVIETIRIEEGVPAPDSDLTEEINPLEAGLHKLISFTKGCYVGQEVVARLDTYQKLQRSLCRFASDVELPILGGRLAIFSADKEVGWISSACYSPLYGQIVSLGYLKTDAREKEIVCRAPGGREYSIRLLQTSNSGPT